MVKIGPSILVHNKCFSFLCCCGGMDLRICAMKFLLLVSLFCRNFSSYILTSFSVKFRLWMCPKGINYVLEVNSPGWDYWVVSEICAQCGLVGGLWRNAFEKDFEMPVPSSFCFLFIYFLASWLWSVWLWFTTSPKSVGQPFIDQNLQNYEQK
jgi:hypothetical protein